MTVLEAYQTAVVKLRASGLDESEARLSARILLERGTGTPHAHLKTPQQLLFEGACPAPWADGLERLLKGEPLAYICRQREFFGLAFHCDNRALIPRPETEMLVEAAIARLQNHSGTPVSGAPVSGTLVADLGTGTGCIAVSVAQAVAQAVVLATDASADALQLARENARRHGVAGCVEFVAGDADNWAAPLLREGFGARFDLLLCNPPYIATREIETLTPQIRDWEPRPALDGGEDGLHCYRQLAAQCPALLQPGGALLVELGAGQFEAVRAIFEDSNWTVASPIFDLAGIARVLAATQSG